ncbi:two component transcriptional regulator, LuxR family [Vibrio xiamenensis]|uniref:Two component transcriptional regulator, LuxR family n=1 Tax=Vibrio xiamenensis TaxID=861298 RepID=A0A1G8AT56_9VIBR|nr:response regulator transcription factor [Vibrio xiamenensis]SDH24252.1 two component transcriptional regulator, LuxR family [Vibrio xiamenensis]
MSAMNILIIDTQPLMRTAIENLVYECMPNAQAYQANNATFGIQLLRNHDIDYVILDVDLENSDGFEFIRRARAHGYAGKVLFISSSKHPMYSMTAYKLGANGYISKVESSVVIKEAILSVARGYSVFKHKANTFRKNVALSNRETVVFNYLIKGYTNKRISELLSLSSKTISTYKSRILDKYNVNSIVELMQMREHLGDEQAPISAAS